MHVGKKVQLGNIVLVQSHHVPLPGHEHGEAGGGVHEHGLERVQEVAEHDREGLAAHLLEDLEKIFFGPTSVLYFSVGPFSVLLNQKNRSSFSIVRSNAFRSNTLLPWKERGRMKKI